ncbi:MAG TPA: tripartite tricarboxylate transporter substrate binding protein [Burkholderiales bacterium]|nr:tripartite tricarboxylate transporter substrate binding protein [Burkholderiales bacterium]
MRSDTRGMVAHALLRPREIIMRHLGLFVTLLLLAPLWANPGHAQSRDDFPSRPITWVVPFAAGGGPDLIARLLSNKVASRLGQPVIVENRPGAGGTMAVAQVATARPDGYTIVHGTNGTQGVAQVLYPNLPYKPDRDLIGVTRLTVVPFMLLVSATSPIMNLQQFVADLKAHPDERTFGTSGVASIPHVAGEELQRVTGTKARHIPYKGGPPAVLNDLLGGRIDFTIDSTTNAVGLVKGGKLRGLAVLTAAPQAFPPDVPTLASIGVHEWNAFGWDAIFVPAGTPRSVIEKLNHAITDALKDPEVSKALLDRGLTPMPTTVDETADFLRKDLPRWVEATRRIDIKPE